jgi:hypothetical protein
MGAACRSPFYGYVAFLDLFFVESDRWNGAAVRISLCYYPVSIKKLFLLNRKLIALKEPSARAILHSNHSFSWRQARSNAITYR